MHNSGKGDYPYSSSIWASYLQNRRSGALALRKDATWGTYDDSLLIALSDYFFEPARAQVTGVEASADIGVAVGSVNVSVSISGVQSVSSMGEPLIYVDNRFNSYGNMATSSIGVVTFKTSSLFKCSGVNKATIIGKVGAFSGAIAPPTIIETKYIAQVITTPNAFSSIGECEVSGTSDPYLLVSGLIDDGQEYMFSYYQIKGGKFSLYSVFNKEINGEPKPTKVVMFSQTNDAEEKVSLIPIDSKTYTVEAGGITVTLDLDHGKERSYG